MRYNKDHLISRQQTSRMGELIEAALGTPFLLPLRVDLIREERRHLVEISNRSTAEYDLEKLKRRAKIHDQKITKRGKTYVLTYTLRTSVTADFWSCNPSNPAAHPWAYVKRYRNRR